MRLARTHQHGRIRRRPTGARRTTTLTLAAGVCGVLCATLTTGFADASGQPSAEQLKAALLSQQDLGPNFTLVPSTTASPGSGQSTVTGCPQLTSLLNATTSGDQTVESQTYQAGQLGPFLSEALVTAPASTLSADHARDKGALTSCKTMTVDAGGVPLTLSMTPTDLGVPGSTAVRLAGTSDGVQITGDLAVDQVGQVETGFILLQLDNTSQQAAMALFKQAEAKVQQDFGSAA